MSSSCSRYKFLNQKPFNAFPLLGKELVFSHSTINLDNPFLIRWHLFPNIPGGQLATIHYSTGLYALQLQLKRMLPLVVIISCHFALLLALETINHPSVS